MRDTELQQIFSALDNKQFCFTEMREEIEIPQFFSLRPENKAATRDQCSKHHLYALAPAIA